MEAIPDQFCIFKLFKTCLKPMYQTKYIEPNLSHQTCQTKLTKLNLPNQIYQTKPVKSKLPNQIYQYKPIKPSLPKQTYHIKPTWICFYWFPVFATIGFAMWWVFVWCEEVTWLEERLRDFSIMNLVKVVNVRVPTAWSDVCKWQKICILGKATIILRRIIHCCIGCIVVDYLFKKVFCIIDELLPPYYVPWCNLINTLRKGQFIHKVRATG